MLAIFWKNSTISGLRGLCSLTGLLRKQSCMHSGGQCMLFDNRTQRLIKHKHFRKRGVTFSWNNITHQGLPDFHFLLLYPRISMSKTKTKTQKQKQKQMQWWAVRSYFFLSELSNLSAAHFSKPARAPLTFHSSLCNSVLSTANKRRGCSFLKTVPQKPKLKFLLHLPIPRMLCAWISSESTHLFLVTLSFIRDILDLKTITSSLRRGTSSDTWITNK